MNTRQFGAVSVLVSMATMLFGAKLLVIGTYGNATPYWDQWGSEAYDLYAPFLEGRLGGADLTAAHNEHRILIPRLLALGILSVNGIWNPLLQMVVNAALHVSFVGIIAWLLMRVVGDRFLPPIAGFCLVLFSLPYGWENTLAGFQSCFYLSLIFGVGAIWLVIQAVPFSARWWVGTGLAIGAFFCLASGVFALAALAAVGVLQHVLGTRTGKLHLAAVVLLGGLFVLGFVLTPRITTHAPLEAVTLSQFLHACNYYTGWPIRGMVIGPLLRNAPAILFSALMLRTRPPADDQRWFLLTLVVWGVGQSLAMSLSRAVGFVPSRYMDILALDILTNFASLLVVQGVVGRNRWGIPAAAAWTAVVLGCLGASVHKRCSAELQHRLDTARAQEINTRNYLATGDIGHLTDKPHLHVPYPLPDRLAAYLDDPTVRSFLPRNLGTPLHGAIAGREAETAGPTGGHAPEIACPSTPSWGTYGDAGARTIESFSVVFSAAHRGYRVQIPVAGDSHAKGIAVEIEQDGKRSPLHAIGDSTSAWGVATAKVRGRPFSVHVVDDSDDAWVAVGSPVAVGRWDDRVDRLLSRWDVFVITGAVMAVALQTCFSLACIRVPL